MKYLPEFLLVAGVVMALLGALLDDLDRDEPEDCVCVCSEPAQ